MSDTKFWIFWFSLDFSLDIEMAQITFQFWNYHQIHFLLLLFQYQREMFNFQKFSFNFNENQTHEDLLFKNNKHFGLNMNLLDYEFT
jgi:hypothetical protein